MIEELSVFELVLIPMLLLMFIVATIWIIADIVKYEMNKGKSRFKGYISISYPFPVCSIWQIDVLLNWSGF